MRDIKLLFFKPSGKYYTQETIEVDESLHVFQIIEYIEQNITMYKGMHIVLEFDEDDEIGYPCLILTHNRRVQ